MKASCLLHLSRHTLHALQNKQSKHLVNLVNSFIQPLCSAVQCSAGQGRAGQGRAGRAGQGRAGQCDVLNSSVQSTASGLVSDIIAIRNCESKVCLIISYVQGMSAVCREAKPHAEAEVGCNAYNQVASLKHNMFALLACTMFQCLNFVQWPTLSNGLPRVKGHSSSSIRSNSRPGVATSSCCCCFMASICKQNMRSWHQSAGRSCVAKGRTQT